MVCIVFCNISLMIKTSRKIGIVPLNFLFKLIIIIIISIIIIIIIITKWFCFVDNMNKLIKKRTMGMLMYLLTKCFIAFFRRQQQLCSSVCAIISKTMCHFIHNNYSIKISVHQIIHMFFRNFNYAIICKIEIYQCSVHN